MNAETVVEWIAERESLLWVLAIVFYGIGDTATTLAGLSVGGVAEAGPIAGPVIETLGNSYFLGLKALTLGLSYAVWSLLRTPGRVAVPLAFALVGGGVTIWNTVVIVVAHLS